MTEDLEQRIQTALDMLKPQDEGFTFTNLS